jgi:hypothetical protein
MTLYSVTLTASLNKGKQGDNVTLTHNTIATWISEGHAHFYAIVLVSHYEREISRGTTLASSAMADPYVAV